jgi:hypothetical protein
LQAFFTAAIYLTLKQALLTLSPQYPPKFYPWILISSDILSTTLQSIGGAIASVTNTDRHLSPITFNTILRVGICLQAFTLLAFGVLAGFYAYSISRARLAGLSRRFRTFLSAMLLAYLVLLIRCLYRIAERSGGWKNHVSRNEVDFMIADAL